MTHQVIEYNAQCKACEGTGIYVGFIERDGAGVVCYKCKGTGGVHVRITYNEFTGRVPRTDVVRVQQINPGIVVGPEISEFGGLSYDDWAAGAEFTPGTEDRKHVCPARWYSSVDYDLKPCWDECVGAGEYFSDCPSYECKGECWERWDNEFTS